MSNQNMFNLTAKVAHSPPAPPSPLLPPPPLPSPPPIQEKPSSSGQQQNSLQNEKKSLQQGKEYSCKSCSRPDDDEMVQCDLCNEWHHFVCVNVSADIENEDWCCPKCTSKQSAEHHQSTQDDPRSYQHAPLAQTQSAQDDPRSYQHAPLAPTQSTKDDLLSYQHAPLAPTQPTQSSKDPELPLIHFTETRQSRTKSVPNPKSASSSKSIQLNLKRLDEERGLREERSREYFLEKEKRDKEYLDAKYSLLEQQTSDDDSDDKSTCRSERLEQWVSEQFSSCKKPPLNAQPIIQQQIIKKGPENTKLEQFSKVVSNPNETWVGSRANTVPIIKKKNKESLYNSTSQFPDQIPAFSQPQRNANAHQLLPSRPNCIPNLSSLQIETRRIAPKELPSFSGYAEEWPLFIAAYENSTRACGFSYDENLIRLQKCIKGRALDAVRSKLMYPEQVPNIISTLRMMYGRPETVIDSLISKLKAERPPRPDRLDSLVTFAFSVDNIVDIMQASGLHSYLNNPSLLKELTERLPYQIRLNWGSFKLERRDVNLSTFSFWLKQIAQAACEVTDMTSLRPASETKTEKKKAGAILFNANHDQVENNSQVQRSCLICNNNCKAIDQCTHFKNMSLKQKWEEVKKHFLCRTCLIRHYNRRCTSLKKCGVNNCLYKHHKLLHKHVEPASPAASDNSARGNYCNTHKTEDRILFKILPVTLYNNNIEVQTFAFFDDGSSVTLIDDQLADMLQLKGKTEPLCLRWTSNTLRTEHNSRKVTAEISACGSSNKYFLSNIRTVGSLNLPSQSINYEELKTAFPYLRGIPIQSYLQAKPQILIGMDQIRLTNSLKHREGNTNEPAAIKTRLGWTVFGPCVGNKGGNDDLFNFHACECQAESDGKLHELVRDFFAIDNIGSKDIKRILSGNDIRANTLLESCTKRIGKRFSVPLLWKGEYLELPDSRPAAERRMLCLEKRLSKDPILATNLDSQIQVYLSKGYARRLTENEIHDYTGKRIWYLPIFPVFNPNKPSKVRIVWDAAARVDGVSLNSMLLSGPDNLPSLPEILFRFRQRKIAICGDIREMFHQIMVQESDQNAQRFLWRNSDNGKIEDYVMQVLTFGSTCSPCCAEHIKNKNALEYSSTFPRATNAIIHNHYVDDFLDSLDTEEEAVKLAKEVIYIHEQGGFEIRNFMSNSLNVTKALGKNAAYCDKDFKQRSGIYEAEKILGMWWSPTADEFSFLNNSKKFSSEIFSGELIPTKRDILKILMSVFDPVGLIAHYLVLLKILLQEVWKQRTQWDEEIHPDQLQLWREWVKLLPIVRQIRIKRPYLTDLKFESGCTVELHIFVDASMSAYAAVAYLRVKRGFHIECSLVCSRTKVGPIKQLSVPRMELEAAVLGIRLAKTVIKGHSIKIEKRYFWSDSQSVLCWIKNDSRKVKQFVMFRVGEILENSSEDEWRWIPSNENPADDATKWNLKIDLSSESRWYRGPKFLYQSKDTWPSSVPKLNPKQFQVLTHSIFHLQPLLDYTRFSSWKKLRSIIANVYRFLDIKLKRREPEEVAIVTTKDKTSAEFYLVRLCQFEAYANEINILRQVADGSSEQFVIEKSNSLYGLNPYIDENNIMRIRGRIDASKDVSFNCKRPIILPKVHYITTLIVEDVHERYLHSNFETVVNEIRQSYYIPNLRTVLKGVQRKCQECKNRRAVPVPPLMADLPPARLKAFTRPFSYVRVDYFGPMVVTVGRRSEKRWGVLFTCLTVRAIHIEIAHSLSSDSCILAIQRFLARRGKPVEIWSDNGTNFRGADNELKDAVKSLRSDAVMNKCVIEGIKWNFIPPASPHMGGSWERLIRSVKQTLAHMSQSRNPKDELLLTMMAEVEYIVNSRPLTYVPIDNESDEALTPNHFLLGSSSGIRLTGQLSDDGFVLRKNWMTCEQFADCFWKRWVSEYLPTLTRRTKWFKMSKPISEGDLVIVVDANLPRSSWPRGRVIQVHQSKDGQTRSAVVQTMTGIYTRPTAKLAVLDVKRFGDSDGNPTKNAAYQGGVLPNLAIPLR